MKSIASGVAFTPHVVAASQRAQVRRAAATRLSTPGLPLHQQTCSALAASTLALAAALAGCSVPKLPSDSDANKSTLTAGVVQREIRKGMTGGEVASMLGSPNIVTSGPNNTEVWVYDRTFSQVESANANTGVWFIVGVTGQSAQVARSSQSTLTVVIKFDAEKRVSDVAYHQSKF